MSTIKVNHNKRLVKFVNKELYIAQPSIYSTIKSDDLMKRALDNSSLTVGKFYRAIYAVVNEFKNFLMNGHSVEVPNLGTFRFSVRAKAVEDAKDAGARQVTQRKIIFTPSKDLKESLKKVSLSKGTVKE